MAYTTINKSTANFNTLLYTATGTQSITGAGFQPDMAWVKPRSSTGSHYIADAVRGATKTISPNSTSAEGTQNLFTSFDSDGVSLGSDNWSDNRTAVIWNWKAGGGQGSSNTDGSINTTYTSVNTTAGFSICKWSGTGANATIGHGLGAVPKMFITKSMASSSWCVYHASLGNTKTLFLESNGAGNTHIAYYNNTSPTSSVFSVGTDDAVNHSGNDMIAYCFAEKTGYSKFGKYTGNGNSTDGPFVYTGFKPAWVMIKKTTSGNDWYVWDNKRDIDNPGFQTIYANSSNAEFYSSYGDFLSNGFKTRSASAGINSSGVEYIYMAFGQSLVGSNNVPCTAR